MRRLMMIKWRKTVVDYKNVRVVVVQREGEKDWAETGRYLSIRAYRNGTGGGQLFMGPDIPISSGLSDGEIERIARLWLEAVCGPESVQLSVAA
jgi:hypothetical protein